MFLCSVSAFISFRATNIGPDDFEYKNWQEDKPPYNVKNKGFEYWWWEHHRAKFPLLSAVARKYLVLMASSAPSESLFSLAGHIVSKK